MKYFSFLFFLTNVLFSQETKSDSLNTQIDQLEKRISELDNRVSKSTPEDQNFTRANIEALNVKPSAKTDIKGIELSVGGFIQTDMIFDFFNTFNRYGYINDLGWHGYDANFVSSTNTFENNKSLAMYCYYNHWLSKKIAPLLVFLIFNYTVLILPQVNFMIIKLMDPLVVFYILGIQ